LQSINQSIKQWTFPDRLKYSKYCDEVLELTLILVMSTKWWAPASARKWRMGFNSMFKGIRKNRRYVGKKYRETERKSTSVQRIQVMYEQ
jgi:hypothetical protein